MGRGFTADDERNHAPIAVLSYNYWTRRFAREPKRFRPNPLCQWRTHDHRRSSAEGFEGLEPGGSTDFWIPLQNRRELNAWGNPPDDGKPYIANPTWWCLRLIGASRQA